MLKTLMDDKKIDLDAPLLSVRRFSAGTASPVASDTNREMEKEEERDTQPPPPRRASLPFYKSDLKSGPIRVPGVVPFVWEKTPGQPKNGGITSVGGVGKPLPAPKPPPGRIHNAREADSSRPAVKLGSSVRTRKAVSFATDVATAKPSESPEDSPTIIVEDKVEKVDKMEKAEKAEEEKVEKTVTIDMEKKVEKAEIIEKVEYKPEKQPIPDVGNHEEEEEEEEGDEDDDAFSDALDTLSRTESFINCSVSGLSGITDATKLSARFPKDPQVRDFMMGRFLPAAQAMACDSPQYTFRKTAAPPRVANKPVDRTAISDLNRRPAPIPDQHQQNCLPDYAKELEEGDNYDEDDEDDEYYDDSCNFPAKGCGLLPKFCLKSSFCLLNPVPGVRIRGGLSRRSRGRSGSPQIRNARRVSLGQMEDELSWEDVYRKKIGKDYHAQMKEMSKLRSESDSQTADCSSPYGHSAVEGTPSDQNDGPQSFLHERKGSVTSSGIPSRDSRSSKTDCSDAGEKDIGNHWEIYPNGRMGSGSFSPAMEKTHNVDLGNRPGSSDSKSSSFNTIKDTRILKSSGEFDTESRRIRENIVAEALETDALEHEVYKDFAPVLPLPSERLNHGNINGDSYHKLSYNGNGPLKFNKDLKPLLSLQPPPLPKSPSESWLSRTLPSVTSKSPAPGSLLGIQLQPRKQTLQASPIDVKQESSIIKPSKPKRQQILFAEVLAKPESPMSGI